MRLNYFVRMLVSVAFAVCVCASERTELYAQRDQLQVEVVQEQADADTDLIQTKKIRESLATRVNLRFKAATLEQIATALRDEFQIQIRVDHDAIRSAGLDPGRELDVNFSNVALSEGLSGFLLNAGLGYSVSGSSLVFTTHSTAIVSKATYSYDVSDIMNQPKTKRVPVVTAGDQATSPAMNDIELALRSRLAISAWNGGFFVRLLESEKAALVEVSCNQLQHDVVRLYLQQLRSALKDQAESAEEHEEKSDNDLTETRVYVIKITSGIEAKEYAELVSTIFADQFDLEKTQYVNAIAGTLVIKNTVSVHKQIQLFLKDMQLLGPAVNSDPIQPMPYEPFPPGAMGGAIGGPLPPMGGGGMGGGMF